MGERSGLSCKDDQNAKVVGLRPTTLEQEKMPRKIVTIALRESML